MTLELLAEIKSLQKKIAELEKTLTQAKYNEQSLS
jgi:hypothetical protein